MITLQQSQKTDARTFPADFWILVDLKVPRGLHCIDSYFVARSKRCTQVLSTLTTRLKKSPSFTNLAQMKHNASTLLGQHSGVWGFIHSFRNCSHVQIDTSSIKDALVEILSASDIFLNPIRCSDKIWSWTDTGVDTKICLSDRLSSSTENYLLKLAIWWHTKEIAHQECKVYLWKSAHLLIPVKYRYLMMVRDSSL